MVEKSGNIKNQSAFGGDNEALMEMLVKAIQSGGNKGAVGINNYRNAKVNPANRIGSGI